MSDSELISSYDSDSEMIDGQRRRQLFGQITELQFAVTDMKSAFTTAIQQLGTFEHEEKDLWEKIESNKIESANQVAEVLKLMLSMRTEFVALKNQIQMSNEIQQNLQQQIQSLAWERDLLVEELYKSGSISEQIRYRLQKCHHHFVSRATSGTHSNDSGVAMFSDKVALPSPYQTTSLIISSDQDNESFYEPSHALESPLLHDFMLGLDEVKSSRVLRSYDSESSLINAANKSLTLSSSLGKQCALELEQSENNTDDDDDDTAIASKNTSKVNVETREESENATISSTVLNCEEICREDQRKLIVASVLETERSYCKTLLILHEIFAEPLKRSGIISSKDINTLFPNEVYQIYENHSTLLLDLEEAVDENIGQVFDKFTNPTESNVLRLYTSYVDDFPEVLKVFHKLCRQKNKKFTNFLQSCLAQPECSGRDLGVFLVAPVQRIPCYILFLKKLLKICGENHLDQQCLQNSLQRLKDLLERLNDTMEHSFQLIVSQIHSEKDRLHSNGGYSKTLMIKNKMTPLSVTNVTNVVPSLWQASQKMKNKEGEESNCGDTSGSGRRSNSGRCYRYPWRARTNSQDGSICSYPTCQLEITSAEAQHNFACNFGRCKLKLCSTGAPMHLRKHEEASEEGRHLIDEFKVPQAEAWEETDFGWNPTGMGRYKCTNESHVCQRKVGKNGSCCDLEAEMKGECKDCCENGENSPKWENPVPKSNLDVKCKQMEECTSSEPNLADPNSKKVLVESQCQHSIGNCYCILEKGASLGCIIPTCGNIGDGGVDQNIEYKNESHLAKSQSAFAVHNHHHHHHHSCALSENVVISHLNNSYVGSMVTNTSPSKISHSASSPTLKEKKKISIRTSLKNLLLFKKRRSGGHNQHKSHGVTNCTECHNLNVNAKIENADL